MIARGMKIRKIYAANSLPTLEIEIKTGKGSVRSQVPMGTSAGSHEAVCLPVEDSMRKFAMLSRYFTTNDFYSVEDVDSTLRTIDKTPDFKEIGGNLAIGISSAFLKAFSLMEGMEVFEYVYEMISKQKMRDGEKPARPKAPMPLCNMVGGWKSGKNVSQSNIQEFLLFPVSQKSFSGSIERMANAYRVIGNQLENEDKKFVYSKNIESAWVSSLDTDEILEIMERVAGHNLFRLGLDVAATSIWDKNHYVYNRSDKFGNPVQERLLRTEQLNLMDEIARRFGIGYIEDPFEEEDFVSHSTLTQRLMSKNVLVCGDDLYATNIGRLEIGVQHKSTNCVIIKPNQVGTITDTVKFADMARKNGMKTVMSHRSGETEDVLICHLAIGMSCDYVKIGISGERVPKINEIIRIEEDMM